MLRWHSEHGATSMPAADYIAMLESEVAALRKLARPCLPPLGCTHPASPRPPLAVAQIPGTPLAGRWQCMMSMDT